MAFPNTQIQTTNLDSDADSPSLARVDLYNAVVALNTIIDEANTASGVCVLNASGTISSSQVPLTVTPTGNLTLAPTTGYVKIQNVLRLQTLTTQQITDLVGVAQGDVAYSTDGDAGAPCLSVYDGSAWRVVRLMTEIGGSIVTLSATATLAADLTEVV
jgi:hypothetical protein